MLFADVRGSTRLAEQMDTLAYTRLINRFYDAAANILSHSFALIDKLVGDQVTGYYFPGWVGEDHTRIAIRAAQDLLQVTGHSAASEPWIPIGVGVHTGVAYVGSVAAKSGVYDITALGDAVNVAARLASHARPGELVVSENTYQMAGLPLGNPAQERIELKGRQEPVAVRILRN
jgi:adenylate cyclase